MHMTTELLAGRTARCCCKREQPSSDYFASTAFAAFFEYHGPGRAGCDVCGRYEIAHQEPTRSKSHLADIMGDGHEYVNTVGNDYDTYYCGCRGWD